LSHGDVLITMSGEIGSVGIVRSHDWMMLNQRVGRVRLHEDDQSLLRFVGYSLQRSDLKATMELIAYGAAQANISPALLGALPIYLPSRRTQRIVSEVLSTLDDLVENNRRRIDLLEQMAQAIYREWFVRFRYPGHENASFVDSPLGRIPEGWEVGVVADLCSRIQAGGTPKRSESAFWEDAEIDWYKTGDLTDSVLIRSSEQISRYALEASTARTFEPDTILMAIYGSPTVGRLGLVEAVSSANQAALGLVANPSRSSTEHLWFVLRGLREYLNRLAQGAAQQNVSKGKVVNAPAILPPVDLIQRFTDAAGSSWRLAHLLAREAHAVAVIRNLLLPRLVTGRIDVSELDLDSVLETVA
jgi:type I restriction enzyme S subunit